MAFSDFDIMEKCKKILSKMDLLREDIGNAITPIVGALGTTADAGGTESSGTLNAKLNSLITSLGSIRSYTATNNTASKTGVLSAKLSYLASLLDNSAYGLSAIKTSTTAFRKPTKLLVAAAKETVTTGSGKGVLFITPGSSSSNVTLVVDGVTLFSEINLLNKGSFFVEFSNSFSIKNTYTISYVAIIAIFY